VQDFKQSLKNRITWQQRNIEISQRDNWCRTMVSKWGIFQFNWLF